MNNRAVLLMLGLSVASSSPFALSFAQQVPSLGGGPPYECAPGSHIDPETKACIRNDFEQLDKRGVLPAPSGVTILRPGGGREQAASCPSEYKEQKARGGWRFCVDPRQPEPIPSIMFPPIAGIPYEEAQKIVERHRAELMALPGVSLMGLGERGIVVETTNPSVVPKTIEGLPVEVWLFPKDGRRQFTTHTLNGTLRPIVGGSIFGIPRPPPNQNESFSGTLTAVAFETGMWLIFPAHIMIEQSCTSSPCPLQIPLRQCLNRYGDNNPRVDQPADISRVGWVTKWTPFPNSSNQIAYDLAAAWMDSDKNQRNSSLCTTPFIDGWGPWTGTEADTSQIRQNDTLFVVSGFDPHIIPVTVKIVNTVVNVGPTPCSSAEPPLDTQLIFTSQLVDSTTHEGRGIDFGDSGSIIMTPDSKIVGMVQWGGQPPGSTIYGEGGGMLAWRIRTLLGFSKWYGTTTMPNNGLGICQ
jgi:hypothetical protein